MTDIISNTITDKDALEYAEGYSDCEEGYPPRKSLKAYEEGYSACYADSSIRDHMTEQQFNGNT